MLKLTLHEKRILDALLTKTPKVIAEELNLKSVQTVHNAKTSLRRKVQNAEQFLSVVKSRYGSILKYKLTTPSIMPETDNDE